MFEGAVLRVSLGETYVMRLVAIPVGAVARCTGTADASLSLSLSLEVSAAGF
jgi:hypothetical protein